MRIIHDRSIWEALENVREEVQEIDNELDEAVVHLLNAKESEDPDYMEVCIQIAIGKIKAVQKRLF